MELGSIMARFPPERRILEDELSKNFLFELIKVECSSFDFDNLLRLWFADDVHCLRGFLEWLDLHGLEIRKKR